MDILDILLKPPQPLMGLFYFLLSYIAGVGVNPGEQTVYHMCKIWLQKVHSGWDMGGVTLK